MYLLEDRSWGSQRIQSLHPEELAEAVISLNYDAIVFDCPPGNEYLERLGVVAADVALVVTNAHPLAVIGAERVWKFWRAIS
jgi:chromosome partitioning protein